MIIYNISSFNMFATLFILFNAIVTASDARRVSHFMSSPHILPDTAVFDDTIQCMSSTLFYALSIVSIVPISAFIATVITSQLYRRNLLAIIGARFRSFDEEELESETDTESEVEQEPTPDEKYIQLYPIKRASHDPPKCLDELKYSIIVEGTPRGILVMCYNIDTEGFEYWSDSDIPLTMLETAARRYVTEYNCKKFYLPRKKVNAIDREEVEITQEQPVDEGPLVDEEPLVDEQEEPLVDEQEEPLVDEQEAPLVDEQEAPLVDEQEAPLVEEESVFIKRKKTDAQVKLEKQMAEEEPVTRFIKRGRLLDFKPKELFKGMNFDEQIVKKTLDYGTFKKAMMESFSAEGNPREDYASIRDAIDSKTQ